MPDEVPDERLIREIRAGDRGAFVRLFADLGPSVRRLGRAITGRDADADDVLQDTFLAAWRAREGLREDGSPRHWVFAIARNAARRRSQRTHREPAVDTDALLDLGVAAGWGADDPEAVLTRVEDRDAVRRALDVLSPDDRELLVLRDLDGVSGDETAALLGVTLEAMKSRLHRARLRLLAALRHGGDHAGP